MLNIADFVCRGDCEWNGEKMWHYLGELSEPPVQKVSLSHNSSAPFGIDHLGPYSALAMPLKIPNEFVEVVSPLGKGRHLSS